MLISLRQKLHKNVIGLIVIAAVIGHGCLCIQDSLDNAVPFADDNNNLEFLDETATNGYSNEADNEGFASSSATPDKALHYPLYINVSEHPGELCNRYCVSGQPRVCYFEFTLEYYQAMGVACGKCAQGVEKDCNNLQCIVGDGVEKGVMSINRQIPGPAIHVCKNDLIIVDVHNNAHGTAVSLHWHGIFQLNSPHMDGVPSLTQCSIPYATSFRYQFYATEAGTQFYHGHSGHHKANGQYGALIVRKPLNRWDIPYDYDLPQHHIIVSDCMHTLAEQHLPGAPNSGGILPTGLLINGRGIYTNPKTNERTKVRPTIYYVTPGQRYRFRLINSISHVCPCQIQIAKHSLRIISSDGNDVSPSLFDTLVLNSGERYDFILEANHTKGDFWLRARGLGVCSNLPIESYALIRYKTNNIVNSELQIPPFPRYEEQYPIGKILNHPNAGCLGKENDHCVTELSSTEYDEELRYATPDHKFYLSFHNYPVSNKEIFEPGHYIHFLNLNSNITVVGGINNNTMEFSPFPLLTQPELIRENQFCSSSKKPSKCTGRRVCSCTHRLKVPLNSLVELFIVDETTAPGLIQHPFHLHGNRYMVTDLGKHPYGLPMTIPLAKEMEKNKLLPRYYLNHRPPFKDTLSIPSYGFAVVRFRANNPGFWLMHCHYEWHLAVGMSLIFQVGDTSQMVKAPKDFPKCGNYLPPVQARYS